MMIWHLAILLKNISHILYHYYNHRNAYFSTVVLKPDLPSELPEVLNKKIEKIESWVSPSIDSWCLGADKDPGYHNPVSSYR